MSTIGIHSIGTHRIQGISGNQKILNNDGFGKFKEMFDQALNEVNQMQVDSAKLTEDFALGKTDNIHQVMVAAEKSTIALQLTMQIRNKALDAYNEIMRMQF
jgi:flagellar hook-basal body complex protein FliE